MKIQFFYKNSQDLQQFKKKNWFFTLSPQHPSRKQLLATEKNGALRRRRTTRYTTTPTPTPTPTQISNHERLKPKKKKKQNKKKNRSGEGVSPSSKEQRSCTLLGPFPPPYSPGRRGARRGEVGGGRKKGEGGEGWGGEGWPNQHSRDDFDVTNKNYKIKLTMIRSICERVKRWATVCRRIGAPPCVKPIYSGSQIGGEAMGISKCSMFQLTGAAQFTGGIFFFFKLSMLWFVF